MPNTVQFLGPPLTTPKVVVAVFGTLAGTNLTVIYSDGTVLDRSQPGIENDWVELEPVPLSARALELDTYTYEVAT